jgi:Holliday junction resolvase RusA-like endonuclease
MTMIRFTIHGEPQGKGRPKFSKRGNIAITRTPEKTVIYENLVRMEYQRQCGNFRFDDDDQLCMTVNAYYAIPKSASKAKKQAMLNGKTLPTKKPDADNVLKVIADSLNQIAYRDDAQIVRAIINKRYALTPCVCVEIESMNEQKEEEAL